MGRGEVDAGPAGQTRSLARAAALGAAVAALAALAIVLVQHTSEDAFSYSDAPWFEAVARDPFGRGALVPSFWGPAYRYGRPLFPLVAWAVVGGRRSLVDWGLAVVFVASVGYAVATAASMLERRGRSPLGALLLFAVPYLAYWIDIPSVVSEPLVLALLLFTLQAVSQGRPLASRVGVALTLLAREAVVVAFVPIIWRDWRERGWRGAASWIPCAVPWALWMVWVRMRIGEWSFLDSSPSRRDALSLPFGGVIDTLRRPLDNGQPLTLLIGLVTVVAGVWVLARRPWYPVSNAACALALVIVCLGVNVFAFAGEASRVMLPAQSLIILAALGGDRIAIDRVAGRA